MMNLNIVIKLSLLPLALVSLGFIFSSSKVHALTGSDFQAGRIIDDAVFTDTSSMSVQDINNFLAAKVPTCDTNGTQPYQSTGLTRAQWANQNGKPAPPYVCLKDYRENPNTHANNLQTGGSISGGVTAGEIIYYAAVGAHINPQVMLATLQKEQGLVTDDWPWPIEYRSAMGFNCPDDGTGCNGYAGFAIQVNSAAAQFRNYLNNPSSFNFLGGQNNYVGYYPCNSGTTVFIQNQSTAALYDYTPYQPDPSVLSNTNPTGSANGAGSVPYADSCATYGNRNFWWYFNSWFGSSFAINGAIQLSTSLQVTAPTTPYINDNITASFQVKNTASYDINAGGLGVCARINGQNYDFGFKDQNIIPAGGTITVSYSKRLDKTGSLNLFICSYQTSMGWASDKYPYDINGGLIRQASYSVSDNPIITSGLILGPSNFGIGQEVTAYASVKNLSSSPINIGSLVIAARDPNGQNVDFPIKNDVIIPAATQSDLTWKRTFTTPGLYNFSIAHWNGTWDTNYPHSTGGWINRNFNWPILDNPLISSGITVVTPTPTAGSPVDVSMTFRNTGSSDINLHSVVIAARDASGKNMDFPIQNDVIVPANSTKTVTWTKAFSTSGTYSLFIAHWWNTWDSTYPKSMDSSVLRQKTLTVN